MDHWAPIDTDNANPSKLMNVRESAGFTLNRHFAALQLHVIRKNNHVTSRHMHGRTSPNISTQAIDDLWKGITLSTNQIGNLIPLQAPRIRHDTTSRPRISKLNHSSTRKTVHQRSSFLHARRVQLATQLSSHWPQCKFFADRSPSLLWPTLHG